MDKAFMANALAKLYGCEAPGKAEGDYIGEDGLLYCGQCHTRKQTKLVFPENLGGMEKIANCCCKCEKERLSAEEEARKLAKDRERIESLRQKSLMDEMFKQSTFAKARVDNYNRKPIQIAKQYAEEFNDMLERNRGIMFYGLPGTGKTFLAACIANYLLDKGVPVMMTSFVKLNQFVRFDRGGDDDETVLDVMSRAKLLIIDDLGVERDTDYSVERVYKFIDNRVRAKLPLILTTNLSLQQMDAIEDIRYMRIYDRVFQVCWPVEVSGPSRRKREAAKMYKEMEEIFSKQ